MIVTLRMVLITLIRIRMACLVNMRYLKRSRSLKAMKTMETTAANTIDSKSLSSEFMTRNSRLWMPGTRSDHLSLIIMETMEMVHQAANASLAPVLQESHIVNMTRPEFMTFTCASDPRLIARCAIGGLERTVNANKRQSNSYKTTMRDELVPY